MSIDIVISIIVGIISSLIAWWWTNILLTPSFSISKLQYTPQGQPYIEIQNKSLFLRAYEVACSIYYYIGRESTPKYMELIKVQPVLAYKKSKFSSFPVRLNEDKKINDFFQENSENRIKIIVVGQNRFGVKQIYSQEINIGNPSVLNPTHISYNDHYN